MRHGNATRFENDVEEGHSDGVRPNQHLLSAAVILWSPLLLKSLPLCCWMLSLMAPMSPARDPFPLESVDARSAGALGFMPRLLVLTTLSDSPGQPHRHRSPSLSLSTPRSVSTAKIGSGATFRNSRKQDPPSLSSYGKLSLLEFDSQFGSLESIGGRYEDDESLE